MRASLPNKPIRCSLDANLIKQAILNLMINATQAMSDGGELLVKVSGDRSDAFVEVTDTGEGISDEDKTRLFEPNFSTKKAGMGIGLTIVNTIIADHNGMISVRDNHPQGAKFVIELPV